MKAIVLVLIVVPVMAFAGGSVLTQQPVTSSPTPPQVVTASRDAAPDQPVAAYGNEVTNAVAEYSLDPTGSLYEMHAPQVEIPRLGSPKS